MKFKSERDILVEALTAASRVAATRLIGASSGVLLSLTGNQLVVTGTDLDITARTTVDVIGIEDGSTVVPARLIVDAVRSLEAGAVTVSSGDDNVEISLGRAKFSLRTFPVATIRSSLRSAGPVTSIAALGSDSGTESGSSRRGERRRPPAPYWRALHDRQRHAAAFRHRLLPTRGTRRPWREGHQRHRRPAGACPRAPGATTRSLVARARRGDRRHAERRRDLLHRRTDQHRLED